MSARSALTTDGNHDLPNAPNRLDQQFTVGEPDKVWAGDITYIHTNEGWLFLAVVIDLFSRQVVPWWCLLQPSQNSFVAGLRQPVAVREGMACRQQGQAA